MKNGRATCAGERGTRKKPRGFPAWLVVLPGWDEVFFHEGSHERRGKTARPALFLGGVFGLFVRRNNGERARLGWWENEKKRQPALVDGGWVTAEGGR